MKTTTKAKPADRIITCRLGYNITHDRLTARYDMMHAQSHRIGYKRTIYMRENVRALGYARDMMGYTHTVRFDNCTIGWDTDKIERLHAR